MLIKRFNSSACKGFTLIELLVVIGLIALMAGGIGVALRSGGSDSGVALQSSQSIITSLLSAARGQAALNGRAAAVMVMATDSDADTYLRVCAIAVRNEADTEWRLTGSLITLPRGIYFLPPVAPSGALVDTGNSFASTVRSSALSPVTQQIVGQTGDWYHLKYTPTGTVSPSGGYFVLSVASPQPPGVTPSIKFTNSNNVRGVSVSKYGIAIQMNESSSFN